MGRTAGDQDLDGHGAVATIARPPEPEHPRLAQFLAHPLTLRAIGAGHLFRDRLHRPMRAHPVLGLPYRVLVAVIGTALVLLGLVLVPAPGPGWLIVLTGLAVLAGEFAWARRLLHFTRKHLTSWTKWVLRQPLVVRGAFGCLGFLTMIVGVAISAKMSGWNGFPFD